MAMQMTISAVKSKKFLSTYLSVVFSREIEFLVAIRQANKRETKPDRI